MSRARLPAPEIKRRIKAICDALGLSPGDVGAVIVTDREVRVLTQEAAKAVNDPFDAWERDSAA